MRSRPPGFGVRERALVRRCRDSWEDAVRSARRLGVESRAYGRCEHARHLPFAPSVRKHAVLGTHETMRLSCVRLGEVKAHMRMDGWNNRRKSQGAKDGMK